MIETQQTMRVSDRCPGAASGWLRGEGTKVLVTPCGKVTLSSRVCMSGDQAVDHGDRESSPKGQRSSACVKSKAWSRLLLSGALQTVTCSKGVQLPQ